MIIAGKYRVPDKCPDDCRFRKDPMAQMQGGFCYRCPVMNCSPMEYQEEDGSIIEVRMVEPEQYRLNWAKEWERFFKEGVLPLLKF